MKHFSLFIFALVLASGPAAAQNMLPLTPPTPTARPTTPASTNAAPASATSTQTDLDRLTESNLELLQLLKKQQAVLEDIQYDRRLQSRQIGSLEERLQEALVENTQLQNKIDALEAAAATAQAHPDVQPGAVATTPPAGSSNAPPPAAPPSNADTTPPQPATYLPPEEPAVAGTPSWHRLLTLSGSDNKDSDLFRVQGRRWRVLWHNQDKPGKAYRNTSALFIHAYPKDDTIPQEACSKLGSGGDTTELAGPGNYYLKVEASGGNWELAVEDFY